MAKNYSINQIVYKAGTCLTEIIGPNTTESGIGPANISGSDKQGGDWGEQYSPYQQIILNDGMEHNFVTNIPYYLKLTIPRDVNYDLNFALLLIGDNKGDLDQQEYQFIRYLNVPRVNDSAAGQSHVVLYERPKNNIYTGADDRVRVAKAIKIENCNSDGEPTEDPTDNEKSNISDETIIEKLFYTESSKNDTTRYWWYPENSTTGWQECNFGKNAVTLVHSWVQGGTSELKTFDIIFTPRSSVPLKYLYLYLIPSKEDNDIQWVNPKDNSTFYGRHIDTNQIQVNLYQMNNLLGKTVAQRIGIWGHSELLFTINGEEIRVGPSGYYELRDFPIEFFGVAAVDSRDQFTADYQYL